ncbi:MAG: 16S rRNA (guanine(527)-N(7))-methyltransferase RsmG [Hyphomicrobium sp.]|jgi:16S rRNA (guanine527-N7)-methyltransferase|nr:16S rRNA (guanine(527)-N(7))-methyltransferase RsmG [Hyphomicrobium sp.]
MSNPTAVIDAGNFAETFGVSRETALKFESYATLLKQWQKAVQLVAPSTLNAVWWRHFADSAQLMALCPPGARTWLDLGSGGGFPGLVIALMACDPAAQAPGLRVTLVESDSRKAAFLREVARQAGCTVDILGTRIESSSTRDKVGRVEVVSARAVAPLTDLLGLAHPFWGPTTVGLFLKGRDVESEVEAAAQVWDFELELKPSLTEASSRVARIRNLNPRGKPA